MPSETRSLLKSNLKFHASTVIRTNIFMPPTKPAFQGKPKLQQSGPKRSEMCSEGHISAISKPQETTQTQIPAGSRSQKNEPSEATCPSRRRSAAQTLPQVGGKMLLSKTSFSRAAESSDAAGTTGKTSHVVQKAKKLYMPHHPSSATLPIPGPRVSRGRSMPLALSCVEKTLPAESNI